MAKISVHRTQRKMAKLGKDIKFCIAHRGKKDKMSENNEIVDKLALF